MSNCKTCGETVVNQACGCNNNSQLTRERNICHYPTDLGFDENAKYSVALKKVTGGTDCCAATACGGVTIPIEIFSTLLQVCEQVTDDPTIATHALDCVGGDLLKRPLPSIADLEDGVCPDLVDDELPVSRAGDDKRIPLAALVPTYRSAVSLNHDGGSDIGIPEVFSRLATIRIPGGGDTGTTSEVIRWSGVSMYHECHNAAIVVLRTRGFVDGVIQSDPPSFVNRSYIGVTVNTGSFVAPIIEAEGNGHEQGTDVIIRDSDDNHIMLIIPNNGNNYIDTDIDWALRGWMDGNAGVGAEMLQIGSCLVNT